MFFPFPFICLYLIPNSKSNFNVPFIMEFFPNKSTFCFTYFELNVVNEDTHGNSNHSKHSPHYTPGTDLHYMYGLAQLMLKIPLQCKSYGYNILLRHEIRDRG